MSWQVGFVLAKQGMQDQPVELLRVDGFHVRATKIGIDVGGKGDAQRIVCVDSYDARVVAQEFIELVRIADGDVCFGEPLR
jgi:hypothetical protein